MGGSGERGLESPVRSQAPFVLQINDTLYRSLWRAAILYPCQPLPSLCCPIILKSVATPLFRINFLLEME